MRFFLIFAFSLVALTAQANPLRVEGRHFVDAFGNHVMLRGVNVSGAAKVPPFRVIAGPEDLEPLPALGFNVIRLLFNWEAFESERGIYDEGYLTYYRNLVRWAARSKLYVIVDIHQDAFSRFSIDGCGEGFPRWALPADQVPAEPKNDERCKNWFIAAGTDLKMFAAWGDFYENKAGVRDRYLAMIKRLSRTMRSESNVIGIDFLNEPWGKEESELFDLYTDAARVVRREMPAAILFSSPVALTSFGNKTKLPRIKGQNVVHSTHFYDPAILYNAWSKEALAKFVANWKLVADDWKAPVFIGEFGARPDLPDVAGYIKGVYDALDEGLYSGTQWVYTPTWSEDKKDGWNIEDLSIRDDKAQLRANYLPRPFVERVSGELKAMAWDESAETLAFTYKPRTWWPYFDLMIPESLRLDERDAWHQGLTCLAFRLNRVRCWQAGTLDLKARTVRLLLKPG